MVDPTGSDLQIPVASFIAVRPVQHDQVGIFIFIAKEIGKRISQCIDMAPEDGIGQPLRRKIHTHLIRWDRCGQDPSVTSQNIATIGFDDLPFIDAALPLLTQLLAIGAVLDVGNPHRNGYTYGKEDNVQPPHAGQNTLFDIGFTRLCHSYLSIILGGVSDSSSGMPRSSSCLMISLWRVWVMRIDEIVNERERNSLTCSVNRS